MKINTINNTILTNTINKVLIHEHVFHLFNSNLKDKNTDFTLKQLHLAKQNGYDLIVDLTPYIKLDNYYDIIDNSPIEIIGCTGYYTGKHLLTKDKNSSEKKLYQKMYTDLTIGQGKRKLKPSIIKIATNMIELKDYEKKIFKVAINVSNDLNIPIAIHAPRNGFKHYQYLKDVGINPKNLMMLHLENDIYKYNKEDFLNNLCLIINDGAYVQLSDFGSDHKSKKTIAMINLINELYNINQFKNLLLSNDCYWNWNNNEPYFANGIKLKHDYLYIENYVIPLLNILVENKQKLLHDNPINFLLR